MGYGSQAEREFSWYLKGPLKACEMALRLKTHTAEAAMLFLGRKRKRKREGQKARQRPPCSPRPLRTTQSRHLLEKLKITAPAHARDEVGAVTSFLGEEQMLQYRNKDV